ncbi:MAG TPA: hypothetical protein VI895_10780 [Bdellovibrionota bacterium]|nr:hypothetical protein [Bdellovibrionota bacterium]
MKTKVQKEFVDTGFGFPILLLNVPMIRTRGVWTPKIDYNALALAVLQALARKPSPLTGNEIQFIRLHFDLTLQQFAKRFDVSHAGVIKWEKAKSHSTNMNWTTEKDLRLFILSELEAAPKELASLYGELQTPQRDRPSPLRLNAMQLAA